ncbi:MAG: glycosyltransferase 87 family protein [Candidatus Limnocylindria bacterium]
MDRTDRAFWGATAVSLAALALLGPLERRIELVGEDDLSRLWAAPRAFLNGADPYDPATWHATAVALGTQAPDTAVFTHPPWVVVALLPLALLPLALVSGLWLVASLGLGVAALRSALRAVLPGRPLEHSVAAFALLLSWAGILNAVIGQWGGIYVAVLFGIVLALRRGRPAAAGLLALSFLFKPQLFLLAAPALALHAAWPVEGRQPTRSGARFLAAALVPAAVLIAVSWAVIPWWLEPWSRHIGTPFTRAEYDTIPALLGTLLGPAGTALAPVAILGLVALGLAFHPRSPAWPAVWLALSVAAAPYSNSYDKILLVVPLVLAAGALHPDRPSRGRAVLLAGAAVLLFLTPVMYAVAVARHSETLSPVVPLLVVAAVIWGLWPLRRERSPAPVPAP